MCFCVRYTIQHVEQIANAATCNVISYRKVINTTLELRQWHCSSFFYNTSEQIGLLATAYFVEFEQVNAYLQKFDVPSLKLFDSFILFIVIA